MSPKTPPRHRIIRGGGWGNNPYCLRVGHRHGNPPDTALDMVGFRRAAPDVVEVDQRQQ